MKDTAAKEIHLEGINASPGICVGKAYLVDREGVEVVERYSIAPDKIKQEVKRFKTAVKHAKDEIRAIVENSPSALKDAHILETHLVLLNDKLLYGRTIETIESEQVNAEWALKKVVGALKSTFLSMTDDYLRERSADIVHVSDRIMRNLMGTRAENIALIDKRVILVAHDLSPADTSQINLEHIKGFLTDLGGKASHTGIIAQTLEIPAVVGLEKATRHIKNDDIVIVDGNRGIVIVHPKKKTLIEYEKRRTRFETFRADITRESQVEARTLDGLHLQILGNIELPEEVVSVIHYGGDGIGLYRTEFQYLSRSGFPGEHELFDSYRDVVEVMAPRPVTIRTLDINGDKALAGNQWYDEANPALGLRAIRYCLKKPDIFKTQLRAILRAAAFGNVRIIFPMIATYFEICEALRLLDEAAESLERQKEPFNRDIDIGIMVEVPSTVIMADRLAEKVDFFSIGTNDLIQYTLAIDRGNRQVAHLYQPLDPAILRMIRHVADVAHRRKIKVFMCGEMAAAPHHIPILLGMGFDELSMNPQSIPSVKRMVRSLELDLCRQFVAEAMQTHTAKQTFELIQDQYGDLLKEHFYSET